MKYYVEVGKDMHERESFLNLIVFVAINKWFYDIIHV